MSNSKGNSSSSSTESLSMSCNGAPAMTLPPAISVIIPVWNSGRYFKESLDSVLGQTLKNIEVIIIDDASTDGSDVAADAYAARDPRITVIHHKKSTGAGPARNAGMAIARGEYIAFMDSDDRYPSADILEMLYSKAVEQQADICGGSLYKMDADGNISDRRVPGQYFEKEGWIQYRDYQHDGGFYRFIYYKNFLEEHQITFPDYRRFQDPVFFVKAMTKAKYFYALPYYTYAYRKGHKNILWTYEKIRDHLYGLQDILLFSRMHDYSHLHYLMAKNLLDTLGHKINRKIKICFLVIIMKIVKIIDWNMVQSENKVNKTQITFIKILYKSLF